MDGVDGVWVGCGCIEDGVWMQRMVRVGRGYTGYGLRPHAPPVVDSTMMVEGRRT